MAKPPDPIASHMKLIGQISWAMNSTQIFIFSALMRISKIDEALAQAIFFSIKSDAGQRDILTAIVNYVFRDEPGHDIFVRYQKVISDVNKISGERNAFIHTIWCYGPIEGVAADRTFPKHHRLNSQNVTEQGEKLVANITDTYEAVYKITNEIVEYASQRKVQI